MINVCSRETGFEPSIGTACFLLTDGCCLCRDVWDVWDYCHWFGWKVVCCAVADWVPLKQCRLFFKEIEIGLALLNFLNFLQCNCFVDLYYFLSLPRVIQIYACWALMVLNFWQYWLLTCISIRYAEICGFASSLFMFRTWKSSWRRRKQQDRSCSWRKCSAMPKSRNWRKIMPLVKIQTKRCVCMCCARTCMCTDAFANVPLSNFCLWKYSRVFDLCH
jgi:hypothetical protein